MPITLAQVDEARRNIAGIALRTPLVKFGYEAPADVYLKLENLQPIGSFKIRGAANVMARTPRAQLERGVLTASAGNMAQGVAFCARRAGVAATIIAPDTAPKTKVASAERLGGRVILVPFADWWRTFETRSYPGVDVRLFGFTDRVVYDAGNANRCAVHALEAGGGNNDAAGLWHAALAAKASRRRFRTPRMREATFPRAWRRAPR